MNMQKTGPAYEFPEITQETPVIKTETWRCAEIVFTSGKEYSDPFADVRLDLILTGAGRLHISTSGCVISRYYFLCATGKFAIIIPRPAENASLQNNEKRYTK